MTVYFWNGYQNTSNQLITWMKQNIFNIGHVKHYVLLLMIWDFDLGFSIFLTFSYFLAFAFVSIKKIVSFTFLWYFNLKVEYKEVLFIFFFLLVWSWSIPYLTILALPPPFSKSQDLPLVLFLKRNHPKKYQVSKCSFYKKQVSINWFM